MLMDGITCGEAHAFWFVSRYCIISIPAGTAWEANVKPTAASVLCLQMKTKASKRVSNRKSADGPKHAAEWWPSIA